MRQSDSVGGPIRCGAFSETAESGEKLIGDSKHIAERALAYEAVSRALLRHYIELFPNLTWVDPEQALAVFAREIQNFRYERGILRKDSSDNANDVVKLMAILRAILANKFEGCLGPDSLAVVEDICARWGIDLVVSKSAQNIPKNIPSNPEAKQEDAEKQACQPEPDMHPKSVCLPPIELEAILDSKTKEIEAAGLCQWGYVTDPDSIDRVLAEIRTLRADQDRQWGGPKHDDTHTEKEWPNFIAKFLNRAAVSAAQMTHTFKPSHNHRTDYEANVLCVAALAVAAIQSSRRRALRTCRECKSVLLSQHRPSCSRQGIVFEESVC